MVARGTVSMQEPTVNESIWQQVFDQFEELAVTIIEEIRARPRVALAVVAGLVGALIGVRVAEARRASRPKHVPPSVLGVAAAADMVGLAIRLLQNPIVRALLLAVLERQISRRLRN